MSDSFNAESARMFLGSYSLGCTVTLVNRVRKHVVLATFEGLTTLLATAGVVLLLALAGGGVVVGRALGAATGMHQSLVALLTGAAAALPLLGALSVPFLAVAEYRRFFGRYGADPSLIVVSPVVAVAAAAALWVGPWGPDGVGVLVLGVVGTHLLALRVLGYRSRTSSERTEQFVAAVGAAPLAVALLTTATRQFFDGVIAAAGQLLVSTPGWQSVPTEPPVLLFAPLLTVGVFEGLRSIPDDDRFSALGERLAGSVGRLQRRGGSISLPSIADTCRRALSPLVRRVRDSGDVDSRTAPPVPTPPQSSRGSHQKPDDRDEEAGTESQETGSTVTASDGPTDGRPPTESTRDTPGVTPIAGGGAAGSTNDDRPETPAAELSPEPDSAEESASESVERPESVSDDPATVTRIYSGEFEQDSDSSVATCPDCDADLPSDGSFEFCPLCGHQLS